MRVPSIVLVLSLAVAACAQSPVASGRTVTVACATFESQGADGTPIAKTVSVTAGQGFTVVLCSNPSTGFSWEQPTWEGDAAVELVQRGIQQTVGAQPGAAGAESFEFKATKAGTTVIHFTYSQPWAGGTKGAWRADVTATVQ
jgi:predicted secreted protein